MVTENTATSITITWDSGNPDPVSYYVIEYKSKSQDGPYQIKEDVTTTRYSIGGLSPNSEYEIWVSAVNSIGQGPPSESVVTRTGEQAPASAPRNVQARMLSATTMIVQWEEPVEPNGLIRGYRVYYTMEPEHPVGNWQKHNVDDSLLTTVGSLLEDETYTVRVLAFTSVGDGPLSDPIQVKTQQGGEEPAGGARRGDGRPGWPGGGGGGRAGLGRLPACGGPAAPGATGRSGRPAWRFEAGRCPRKPTFPALLGQSRLASPRGCRWTPR